jgi:hypothetical protein
MNPWAIVGALVAAILIGGAGFRFGDSYGTNAVQAKWDADKAVRATAEKAAVLDRVAQNQQVFRQQEITNQNITKAHDEELAKVRADLSHASRMRIGSALCSGPAGSPQTASAGSGNAADTAGRVLSAEMDGAVKSLILEMEQVAATGRSCQSFARSISK